MYVGRQPEKQGELGDLADKSVIELRDLLRRQEGLLANKPFLSKLKDKGAKVENLVVKLRKAIAEKEEVDQTMQLFQKMDLESANTSVSEITRKLPAKNCDGVAESAMETSAKVESDSDRLLYGQNTSQETLGSPREKMDESTAGRSITPKAKFQPHRHLKSTSIPDDLSRPAHQISRKGGTGSQHREPDFTSARMCPLRNQEAQVVDLQESAKLLEEQKQHVEALIAKQAAERLSERLNITMGDFIPTIQKGSYRSQDTNDMSGESSEDSVEDEEENDSEKDDS
ncbi:DNA-directed RNA polymerase II subunit GRINL1A-like [Diadema antillarum]|uniref:DNA-directed RNA polymerase II subunit GRINL1A-like n=1 Tax=Diadema antillarum TaxID=105358 RepID=UPI003A8A637B